MVVEFQVREAINSLVALLRVAEDSAVHCWEQEEPFHPGIFPGLILLARLAADRAGEEFRQATTAAELTRWNANLRGERDHLLQRLTEVTAERDAALKRVAELSGNSGELPAGPVFTMEAFDRAVEFYNECLEQPAEPAPEWHRWNHDTKLFHQRHPDVTRGLHDATAEDMERMYCNGWRELPETEPEPYQWQVGDEINPGNGDRILVVQHVRDGLVKFCGEACTNAQEDLEKFGCTLHRKASDLPPEPYEWQVGDEIAREDGTLHIITRAIGGLLWFKNETLGASAQWWLTENGYRLHRKASDLPDIEPMTAQQVAEFAAVTEPIDDSVGADGEGQS